MADRPSISEIELLALARGQAPDELRQAIEQEAAANPEIRSAQEAWSRLSPALDAAAQHSRTRIDSALQNVIVQVRKEIPSRATQPARAPVLAWRKAAFTLAAAALLLAFFLSPMLAGKQESAPASPASFAQAEPSTEVRLTLGIERLEAGVAAVAPGGELLISQGAMEEGLRIAKPLRMVAVDGAVVIGRT